MGSMLTVQDPQSEKRRGAVYRALGWLADGTGVLRLRARVVLAQSPRWQMAASSTWRVVLGLRAWRWWQWAVALPVAGVLYVLLLIPFTPSISDLHKAKLEQPAQVLTADGKELAVFKRSNRQWVDLDHVAPAVVQALIATEDHRFYEHHGMDWRRTAASVLHSLRGDLQGGSTLTQQLARNLYPEEIGREASLNRKLKEAITAFKIESIYTKEEILETYLNTVPFLYNAWGIEMAARTYFDKSASRLSVLEAATLVGMLKGTSYYNPVRNPQRALERRNTVLSQMVKRGVLSEQERQRLNKRPLQLDFERQDGTTGMAPHFAQQVRKWLIRWADDAGYNIYTDGLVVHTTLDSRWQAWAQQAVRSHTRTLQGVADSNWSKGDGWNATNPLVQRLVRESSAYAALREKGQGAEEALQTLLKDRGFMQQLRKAKTRIEAGFVAMEPETAAIRAWVGSRDFVVDAFDHVQQAHRQPGSTFKPFVYGAALQEGMSPDDELVDQSVAIRLSNAEIWRPADATAPTGKPLSLRDALAYSKNTITAQLVEKVGAGDVARLARGLGVRSSHLDEVPALALGVSPVTLLEMTNAYGSLVRGGQYRAPLLITRIEDRHGKVQAQFAPASAEKVMDLDDSYTLVDMMRGVVDKGTGRAIRQRYGIRDDVAGKTGTTQNNADGWFILMHPRMVVGAWAGFNDARVNLRSDYWGQGARSALPMVGDFAVHALRSQEVDRHARFVEPDREAWWVRWTQGMRSQWQSWWPHSQSAKPAVVPGLPARPAVVQPMPEAVDAVIEESTPVLPVPTAGSSVQTERQEDALDAWMEQWAQPELSGSSDWERLPPAVRGRPLQETHQL